MTHSQESRVSSTQDSLRLSEESISSVSALVNKLNSCTGVGADVFGDEKFGKVGAASNEEKKMEAAFPWIRSFGDSCRTYVGGRSIKALENLLTVYLQHVSIDVKNCYMKPNRAAKLKKCMTEALLFFHMTYQEVREPMEHSFYLSKMTDLLSMYMDMEIKASRRRKETTKKVVGRLTTSLYVLLDHSEHHMLDVILNAKLFTKPNRELCIPILRKLMTSLHMLPLYELLYVRCVLVFKLWKKLAKDGEEKKHITRLAIQRLAVRTNFLDKSKLFSDVLPRIPKSRKNITLFFMQAKFNLKSSCKAFLKMCKDSQPLGDKPLFFDEHLGDSPTTIIRDKADDVGGGRNSNLLNNLWSSISVVTDPSLTECSQLKASAGDEEKDVLTGKKQKSEVKLGKKSKNKSRAQKNNAGNIKDRNKKKKKVKKKSSGDTISVLDSVRVDDANSLQTCEKGDVDINNSEETDKSPTHDVQPQIQEEHVSSEQQLVMVKTEKNAQDLCIITVVEESSDEHEEQRLDQVNKINSVGYVGDLLALEGKHFEENLPPHVTVPVVMETAKAQALPDALEQVNQVNSACSEYEKLEVRELVDPADCCNAIRVDHIVRRDLETECCNAIRVDHIVRCDLETEVVQVSSENLKIEKSGLNQVNYVSAGSEVAVEGGVNLNRVIGESVIVPASSNTLLIDCLVNTSHKSQPTTIIENEAVPSVIGHESQDASGTDMMAPKIVHPYLVPSRACDGCEVPNVVPSTEEVAYVCDSSIKLEDSVPDESYVVDSVVPIPKEGCGGVDNDYFSRIYPEDDSDMEILTDLRQQESRQRSIPEEEREALVRNERDLLPRDSVPSNIFSTENSDLLIEALGDVLPVTGIDFESRVLYIEDGATDSPFFCGGDDATELESPAMEALDENEKRSLASMINNFRCSKDKGTFAQFGTERQDWFERNGHKFLVRDSMLLPHHSAYPSNSIMDNDDDDDDERNVSSDAESCYESNFSSASSSPRQRLGGGKFVSHDYARSMKEKEVLDSSPSSNVSDSSPTANNTYIKIRDSCKINNGSLSICDREIPDRPRIGEKIPAPVLPRSTHHLQPVTTVTSTSTVTSSPTASTLKKLNVNLMKCVDGKAMSDQKKLNRTPRFRSATKDEISSCYLEPNVDVSSNRFPDVVRDAHNATEKSDKEAATIIMGPQKTSRGTISSETGNNVVGKSVKSNIQGLYRGVPMVGAGCVPPSIPYPTIPTPATMAKTQVGFRQYVSCTCSECYVNHLAYLSSYNPPQEGDRYSQVPMQYRNSGTRSEMETLKSQDEELLRRIEASLIDSKYSKLDENSKDEDFESKYKPNLDSSLPLKKRLKTLTHIEPTKVKTEFEVTKSTQADSFPSYPSRPMISIAELELNRTILNKLQQHVSKSVRTSMTNIQKYPQYSGPNTFYANSLQPNNDLVKRMPEDRFAPCRRYAAGQSDMPKISPVCKVEGPEPTMYSPGAVGTPMSSSTLGIGANDRKLVNCKEESIGIGFPNQSSNECFVRPFKTPAQLKEIVPMGREFNVLKSELPRTPVPPLIPLVADTPVDKVSGCSHSVHYANAVKQETATIPVQVSSTVDMFGRQNVLDLSKQALKETKSHRNSRKKRNTVSDVKPRNSKRSRRETVIQNSETVNDLDNKYRRKRSSHIPR